MLSNLNQDIRYAARQLRRAPGFTLTALLTLTLAIGAAAAMVSVLRATLLNPTPYADAAQLVSVQDVNLKGFETNGLVSVARTVDIADAPAQSSSASTGVPAKLFASSAFYYFDQPSLVTDGHLPLSVWALRASGGFFKVLGTQPLLGRWFTPTDDTVTAPKVAVIGYGLWQRAFAGGSDVIGKTVTLAGKPTTIVGVMPKHFDYPGGTEVWDPATISYEQFNGYRGSDTRFVSVIGRLRSGESLKGAQNGLDLVAGRLAKTFPDTDAEWGFKIVGLRSEILGSYRQGLLLLSSAVAMLLLIAFANIAGLQLSRNAKRQPEMALRRALGIGTGRLLQQLITESLLLTVTGSLFGVALCLALLRVFAASLPPALLSFASPKVDPTTLVAAVSVGLVAGVLCSIVPALQFGRTAERDLLASSQNRVARGAKRFDRVFASLQLALALVLLALASSLLQNLHGLQHLRLGYDMSHVLTASAHLPWGTDVKKAHRFHQQLEQSFAGLPGVESVGAIDALPLTSFMVKQMADIQGQPLTPHHDTVTAESRSITPTYLSTMKIPLLAGRYFTARDGDSGAPCVVMVNETLAAKYFPRGDAIGKHLIVGAGAAGTGTAALEIVGIVADVRGTGGSLDGPIQAEIYEPEHGGWPDMQFVLRTTLSAAELEPAMRQRLASIDGGLALGPVTVLSGSLHRLLLLPRLNTALLTALAGLALVLVLIGVYGVIAYSVSQRTREIGVRIALGSTRWAILQMVLRESTAIFAIGITLGIAGAVLATKLLHAAVPGMRMSIVGTLALSALLLAIAVLGASLIPARRASRIEPTEALRSE
jgi:putative ABC transport system permease protein